MFGKSEKGYRDEEGHGAAYDESNPPGSYPQRAVLGQAEAGEVYRTCDSSKEKQ